MPRHLQTETRYSGLTQLTIEHREQMRHLTKNEPIVTRDDKVAKEIIGAYNKFGIENANPTRAIMRRTGVDVAKATQLVKTRNVDWQV